MLKLSFQLLLVSSLITGTLWAATDPFVGNWKLNPSRSKLTDQMKVKRVTVNTYAFDFGGGSAETIKVDGREQPGDFGTTLSVTIEGPDSWKVVRKKDGRTLITANWKLSKDGKMLTDDFIAIQPNGSTFNLKYVYKRTAGTSGFAGTWESTSTTVDSVYVLEIRPYEGNGLSFIDRSEGVNKNVRFDGKDYPNAGPNAAPGSVSSAHRASQQILDMTDKINGKIVDTQEMKLAPDPKTLTIILHTVGRTEPNILVLERQ